MRCWRSATGIRLTCNSPSCTPSSESTPKLARRLNCTWMPLQELPARRSWPRRKSSCVFPSRCCCSSVLASKESWSARDHQLTYFHPLVQRSQIAAGAKELAAARQHQHATPPRYEACITSASVAINVSPNNEELRLIRADCYYGARLWDSTIGDLQRASTLSPALPPHLLLRFSLLSSFLLDNGAAIVPAEALLPLKRCLSADPDSKACRGLFKNLKALEKELSKLRNWVEGGRWTEAAVVLAGSSRSEGVIKTIRTILSTYQSPLPSTPNEPSPLPAEPTLPTLSPILARTLSDLCRAYIMLGQSRKATNACQEVLEVNEEDVWGLVGKADAMMAEENWEEAVRLLSASFEATGKSDREVCSVWKRRSRLRCFDDGLLTRPHLPSSRQILGRLQKAQRLLKQSKAKVRLGLPRLRSCSVAHIL